MYIKQSSSLFTVISTESPSEKKLNLVGRNHVNRLCFIKKKKKVNGKLRVQLSEWQAAQSAWTMLVM